MSASSLAFLALFPQPQNSNLVGNYNGTIAGGRYSAIPSVKIDEILSDKDKLSFFWTRNNTESQISSPLGNADGLPTEIGAYRGTFIPTWITRLNYDRTISPTMLLHLGAGYYHTSFNDHAPFLSFNPSSIRSLRLSRRPPVPELNGIVRPAHRPPRHPNELYSGRYRHSFRVWRHPEYRHQWSNPIAKLRRETELQREFDVGQGRAHFQVRRGDVPGASLHWSLFWGYSGCCKRTGIATATAQPYTPTTNFNGYNMGFGFASFLLGDYASVTQTPSEFTREGSQEWGLFAQDSWKVRRNLTVTYGVRWDYATPEHEQYGRLGQLDPTLPNANAGGALGAVQYANTCNCNFYKSAYPFALGPRLGVAYQLKPKTVLRGGWGYTYQFVANPAGTTIGTNGVYPLSGINPYVNIATPGAIEQPSLPVTNPYIYPSPARWGYPVCPIPMSPTGTKTGRPASTNSASASSKRSRQISSSKLPTSATALCGWAADLWASVDGTGPITPPAAQLLKSRRQLTRNMAFTHILEPALRAPTITRITC